MGTSDPATLRTIAARRETSALLSEAIPTIAADAASAAIDSARARENSEVLRQELMPQTIPAEPDPA